MNTKTKLTALLMSILMIVAMIPAFALTISADDYVAEVTVNGGTPTKYTTFADAWAAAYTNITEGSSLAAASKTTIKLLKDTDMGNVGDTNDQGAYMGKYINLTLDLNGCVLTPPTEGTDGSSYERSHFYINARTSLTIKDTNPAVVHKYKNVDGLYVWDEENGDIVIPGGALTGGMGTRYSSGRKTGSIFVGKTGKLTIEGGNFIGNSGSDAGVLVGIDNPGNNQSRPEINISDGLFIGNKGKSSNIRVLGGHLNSQNSSITGGVFVVGSDDTEGYTGGVLMGGMNINFTTTDETLYESTGVARVLPFAIRGVQQTADKSAMRLIAEVDQALLTGATEAGFKVCLTLDAGAPGDVKTLQSAYYYTKLLAQDDVDTAEMTVIEPTEAGRVLIAVVITGIPVDASARTFTVNPYFVKDGVTYKFNTAYNVTIAAVTGQASVSVAE